MELCLKIRYRIGMRKIVAIFVLCVFAVAHGFAAERSVFASQHMTTAPIAQVASNALANPNDIAWRTGPSDEQAPASDESFLKAVPEECCDRSATSKPAATHCSVDCMMALPSFGTDFSKRTHLANSVVSNPDEALYPATLLRPPIS